ncbi:SERINE/THREONINE-PROTEIN KINASE FRAY2 [Salix koriyanagi]|uniref:SERINE/THREONINE-PROTEIN KINASE FRAY2 n=1 Tax=Salix koriyanagi TaxID=2511006 RepID=A0A9Q0Q9A0_9ROSI|nr:SERINE/THREONINE-PROTEIN KINASE FRAY2 [Salix koriyanagi]
MRDFTSSYNQRAIAGASSEELDEKAKPPVVQQRGRFKVTSENVDIEKAVSPLVLQKSHSMQVRSFESKAMAKNKSQRILPRGQFVGQLVHLESLNRIQFLVLTQHPGMPSPSETIPSTVSGNSMFPILLSVLQTNITQRDGILHLMRQLSGGDTAGNRAIDGGWTVAQGGSTEKSLLEAAHDKEKELLHEITELQWRLIRTQEELQKYKTENAQV